MPTTKTAQRQNQIDKQVIQALATLGGERTKDDEIEFVGTRFVFPEQFRGDLSGIQNFVERYVASQQEVVVVSKTFNYRPHDGAHATYQMLKQFFGYAQSTSKMGRFGPVPPNEITVPTGYVGGKLQNITVPWGDMVLPLVNARLVMDIEMTHDKGQLFKLNAKCLKIHKPVIDGFYKAVEQYLEEHSLYRGHAVNGDMEFFDTDTIDPAQFVYSEQVWVDAETHIFSPMRHAEVLARKGLDPKRVVLLEGPFGTGKSGLGRTAAKVAVANGWTALICRPGQDNPFHVMQTARLYLPTDGNSGGCLVFMEDIDVLSQNNNDPTYTSRLLDAFDGFETKGQPFVLVMTTNHAETITQGMTRPGRIHGIISIGAMDRPGVEKLCKVVIGGDLAPGIDFDAVFTATEGYMPAFVREGIERALRYTIARTGAVGLIATEDLVHAMGSLRGQFDLHMAANDRPDRLPTIDRSLREMFLQEVQIDDSNLRAVVNEQIENRMNGAEILDQDGEMQFEIRTN